MPKSSASTATLPEHLDPLDTLLRRAVEQAEDGPVRDWLRGLLDSLERAQGQPAIAHDALVRERGRS